MKDSLALSQVLHNLPISEQQHRAPRGWSWSLRSLPTLPFYDDSMMILSFQQSIQYIPFHQENACRQISLSIKWLISLRLIRTAHEVHHLTGSFSMHCVSNSSFPTGERRMLSRTDWITNDHVVGKHHLCCLWTRFVGKVMLLLLLFAVIYK